MYICVCVCVCVFKYVERLSPLDSWSLQLKCSVCEIE